MLREYSDNINILSVQYFVFLVSLVLVYVVYCKHVYKRITKNQKYIIYIFARITWNISISSRIFK